MITITGSSKGYSTRFTFDTEAELDAITDAFAAQYPHYGKANAIAAFAPQLKRKTRVLQHGRLCILGGANYYRQCLDGQVEIEHESTSQREVIIPFRVTAAEQTQIQQAADELGMKVSAYIRSKIL